jgi:hypothetical protein
MLMFRNIMRIFTADFHTYEMLLEEEEEEEEEMKGQNSAV